MTPWRVTMAALVAIILIFGFMLMARANPVPCAPKAAMLGLLERVYHERPIWIGKANNSAIILTIGRHGSWTLLRTDKGIACIVGTGNKSELDKGA